MGIKPIKWVGKITSCQCCGAAYNGVMYDANMRGRWGNFCQYCFDGGGCSLGIGLGQKYLLQADGSWLLVEGGN